MAHEILVKIQLDASHVRGMLAEALDCVKKLRARRDRWRKRAELAESNEAYLLEANKNITRWWENARDQLAERTRERDEARALVSGLLQTANRECDKANAEAAEARAEADKLRTELDMAFPPCPGVGGWVIVRRRHGESIEDALRNSLSDLTINATPS